MTEAASRANNPFASWWASCYDLLLALPPIGQIRRSEERALAALLEGALQPSDTLLEIGPGTGRYTVTFAQQVAHVTALEPSAGMVRLLSRRLKCAGITNCRVICGSFPEAQLEPAYDVVALIGVMDYVGEPAAFLAQAAALARRVLIFTTPHCGFLARAFRACNSIRGVRINTFTPEQLRDYLPEFDTQIAETGLRTAVCRGMTLACCAVRV